MQLMPKSKEACFRSPALWGARLDGSQIFELGLSGWGGMAHV